MNYATFLFSFGSIDVYEQKPSSMDLFGTSNFYWKFSHEMGYYGPFKSINAATTNFEAYLKAVVRPAPQLPVITHDNAIYVDFKNKRRIKTQVL